MIPVPRKKCIEKNPAQKQRDVKQNEGKASNKVRDRVRNPLRTRTLCQELLFMLAIRSMWS